MLLDVNDLADDSGYVELGLSAVSPDQKLAGLLGRPHRRRGLRAAVPRPRDRARTCPRWRRAPTTEARGAAGSDHFFYTVHDDAYRPHQVWRHALGTPVADDVLVLEEPDERFELSVRATRSGGPGGDVGGEPRHPGGVGGRRRVPDVAAALGRRPARRASSTTPSTCVLPDGTDTLLLVTNDDATEFRLARCPVPRESDQDHTAWAPARAERPDERLERVDGFAGHAVLSFRSQTQHRLRVAAARRPRRRRRRDRSRRSTAARSSIGPNTEYDATAVTVEDQSYVEPPVWSDVDLRTGDRTELLRRQAPGHDAASYVCESRSLPAARRDRRPGHAGAPPRHPARRHRARRCSTGTAPTRPSTRTRSGTPRSRRLLDRGVVYAHAHVRGGGEGGRRWWLDGRLEHKQHTFTTTSRSPTAWPATGSSTATGSRAAG